MKKFLILDEADWNLAVAAVEHIVKDNVNSDGKLLRPCRITIECVDPHESIGFDAFKQGLHIIARRLAAGGLTVAERNKMIEARPAEVRARILELEKFYRWTKE